MVVTKIETVPQLNHLFKLQYDVSEMPVQWLIVYEIEMVGSLLLIVMFFVNFTLSHLHKHQAVYHKVRVFRTWSIEFSLQATYPSELICIDTVTVVIDGETADMSSHSTWQELSTNQLITSGAYLVLNRREGCDLVTWLFHLMNCI